MDTSLVPRLIRTVPPQLGAYVRPSRVNHKSLLAFLAEGTPAGLEGVVFDPALDTIHAELREDVSERRLEAVLDTRAMELALRGGFVGSRCTLPWAGDQLHQPDRLRGNSGRDWVRTIVEWTAERTFTSILAPAHYLADGISDPWFEIDRHLTIMLREELDKAGLSAMPIYYPLALKSDLFFEPQQREQMRLALISLPIDAIWLRVHPFGTRSGARVVRKHIHACADLHSSALPLVAEKSGTVGLALLAFGAVGGIESGITIGEHFDANNLLSSREDGKAFSPLPRIYLPELQAFLSKKLARPFFENRAIRAHFACKEDRCCPRGSDDTLSNPKRHFLRRRTAEVARLSVLPETLRATRYMEEILRPATDRMARATKVEPALASTRERLDVLRSILGGVLEEGQPATFSAAPEGKRIQARRGA
ncbi:MAG: hypothetical protein QOI24_4691 [Acidobacteriota bacterium]|jgi:hypothetical protein|nr:hypothetical protein [Acidobacteriota bacterium]